MRTRGESPESRKKELQLLRTLAGHLGFGYQQFPPSSGKYRIDGCVLVDRFVMGWVEAKWYPGKSGFCALNVPKFDELIRLSETSCKPSYFVYRIEGRCGFIKLHDGFNLTFEPVVQLAGGTPDHRAANDDDIEPLVMLPKEKTEWVI